MSDLFNKLMPEFILDFIYEQEERLRSKNKEKKLEDIPKEKINLYFDLNKMFQKNKLYLIKRKGDMLFILNTMYIYGEEMTIRWLKSLTINRENSSEEELCNAINECETTFVIELLKNLRNTIDKQLVEENMINKGEYLDRRLVTTEMFAKSMLLNIR